MTDKFREEIREIAEKVKGSIDEAPDVVPHADTIDEHYLEAVGEFFDAASRAVEIFNDVIRKRTLSIHRLNPEFFELFLGIPGRRDGFTIVSPYKIVILFDDEPSTLTVIGKKRIRTAREPCSLLPNSLSRLLSIKIMTGKSTTRIMREAVSTRTD